MSIPIEPEPEPSEEPSEESSDDPAADPLTPVEALPDPEEEQRRYPRTIGGLFYLGVLAATVVGIGIVWTGNWRLGTDWIAGALIFAALVRLVLPHRDAGMLAVRHRLFDALLLAGVGGLLIFLAATIPNQPV